MIQKETYGFNTFAATRIGEIQEGTVPDDWYWVEGEFNIADWITRGKKPGEIGPNSEWQNGPEFLEKPVAEWPVKQSFNGVVLPERVGIAMVTNTAATGILSVEIDITRYSSYNKLIRVTARVLATASRNPKPSLKNAGKILSSTDIQKAETFWVKKAQESIKQDVKEGKFERLCPRTGDDGIVVVGGRAEEWLQMSYNREEVILLPYDHRLSRLYAEHIHNQSHQGVAAVTSKVRLRFWIPRLQKMVKSIKFNCVVCKKLDKTLSGQVMGKLPEDRLKPAPTWSSTAIDLFGPFKIRDEVKKRSVGKAFGVIFNCLATRAVHVDLSPDYSTEKFLMVLRRFVSLRGYPKKLRSDNGSQLTAANEELQRVMRAWNWEELQEFGATEGLAWDFTSADAPWQNGCSEALIKSVKKALTVAIGDSILTYSELQTVCFEAANLVNERPIGRNPTSPDDGTYLCPNDLLLGRASARIPSGPFRETSNPNHRYEFVQKIIEAFWKKWTRDHFPSLIVEQKWHTAQRNLMIGDIVLIKDSNQVRGNWKLGRVSKVVPGNDGKVRNVEVQYKNPKIGEPTKKYSGQDYITVQRAVHRLVVILPIDHQVKQ